MARDQCYRFVCLNRIHSGLNELVTDCRCRQCQLIVITCDSIAFLISVECQQSFRVDPRRHFINASDERTHSDSLERALPSSKERAAFATPWTLLGWDQAEARLATASARAAKQEAEAGRNES